MAGTDWIEKATARLGRACWQQPKRRSEIAVWCPPSHRPSRWRLPGGCWRCGICYPPALPAAQIERYGGHEPELPAAIREAIAAGVLEEVISSDARRVA